MEVLAVLSNNFFKILKFKNPGHRLCSLDKSKRELNEGKISVILGTFIDQIGLNRSNNKIM
jgi:hypothetical protein